MVIHVYFRRAVLVGSMMTAWLVTTPSAPAATIVDLFEGIDSFIANDAPPDTVGAVGHDQIVGMTNGRYSAYDKDNGFLLESTSLTDFWKMKAGVGVAQAPFDPRVVYDNSSLGAS